MIWDNQAMDDFMIPIDKLLYAVQVRWVQVIQVILWLIVIALGIGSGLVIVPFTVKAELMGLEGDPP